MQGKWSEEELSIFALFSGRCGFNKAHVAVVLHEIETRASRPRDWNVPENRIPLCSACHSKIHAEGSSHHINALKTIRMEIEYAKNRS